VKTRGISRSRDKTFPAGFAGMKITFKEKEES
jgi:hypothetical protein